MKQLEMNQKGGFLGILLGALASIILRSALIGRGVIRAGDRTIRASEIFNAASSFN